MLYFVLDDCGGFLQDVGGYADVEVIKVSVYGYGCIDVRLFMFVAV